jgi:hypothetical protein
MWYDALIKQNYFVHNHDIISQHDGLVMGAPSSGLIAELFLQHMEHVHLARLSHKHGTIDYFRYVDDILLIFDPEFTDIQSILTEQHITPESPLHSGNRKRQHHKLPRHFHSKNPHSLVTSIYRKPTFTDSIIPYSSNHPKQRKYAAVKFLYNTLNSYGLQEQEYKQELNIIHNILRKNSFPITPQKHPRNNTTRQQSTLMTRHKWVTLTYTGKETMYITNAFKHTDLKIAFRTNSTIENLNRGTRSQTSFLQAFTN